ncbi:dynein regulatory complex protein 9-like [Agrilus planipennis]|uniref:Dynein regulatory complex protein 9-like n=1 Tax=Agrilus planipennis TaxID=224129 RepID=A0A1W4X3K2_AGRPL|nr:dynein regulatory complex protein 9-like [Agrilus planipennis]
MRSKTGKIDSVVNIDSFLVLDPDHIINLLSDESFKEVDAPPVSKRSDVHVLPRLIAEAFACVLDDTVNKLDLIINVGQLPRVKEEEEEEEEEEEDEDEDHEGEDNAIESQKKTDEVPGEIYDTVTLERLEDSLERQNLSKFVKDVRFVRNLLKKACNSLVKKNSFDLIVHKVSQYKDYIEKRSQIMKENLQIKKEISDLKKSFVNEKKDALKEIDKIKKETQEMRNSLGLQVIIENTKMHYVQKWETSRNQLNTFILTRQEDQLKDKITRMTVEMEREEKVHEEVEKFLSELEQDYEKQVEEWMERYDREMEQLDYDISVTNEKIEEQEIANAKIKQKYEERQKFIEEWLVYREQKRLERERFERITEASISIQCWWRVVMIKKKLGPYGKKKKGKGKGKGKKK